MNREIRSIKHTLDLILNENRKLVSEASPTSDSLLGGDTVKIPRAGAHAGQSGWQSSNAWDIKAAVGTPVYAIADGVAQTFNDYGRNVTATQGKKLYGQSFTVRSDGNLPDVYYTHLEGSPVRKGSKIKCGQFIGYIMDFPGSEYDHVHIGVESGDINQFLTPDGKLKCGGSITGGSNNSTPEKSQNNDVPEDETLYKMALGVGRMIGLKEQFGKNIKQNYGVVTIPGSTNPKIKSPIDGVVNNSKYVSGCKNQITIQFENNGKFYLQFCGLTKPLVKNGDKIKQGQVIGKMDKDDEVEVILFDSSYERQRLKPEKIKSSKPEEKTPSKLTTKKDERTYPDAATAWLITRPSSVFKNRYDKNTGELKQKRMKSSMGDSDVDPWVLDAIKAPFKKIGKMIKGKKNEEKEVKKIKENVERIKKLL